MLIQLNIRLRRHRRRFIWTMAVVAVTLAALSAHSALMNAAMGDHAMSDAAAACLAVGGSLALAGVAIFATRRVRHRPFSPLPALCAPELPFVPRQAGFPARAGPPSVLQVFRL